MDVPVHVLLATIPERRASCGRLIEALARQALQPDRLDLVLDGYGDAPFVATGIPSTERRTPRPCGPGGRWRSLIGLPADAILVVLDDDQRLLAPDVLGKLVKAVEAGGAASCLGFRADGNGGAFPAGTPLVALATGVMSARVGDLDGLDATAAEIREKCGFDPFGDAGDDEAVVSAHLWRKGVPMRATGPLAIATDGDAQATSQTKRRQAARGRRRPFWQREAIALATGWPWRRI